MGRGPGRCEGFLSRPGGGSAAPRVVVVDDHPLNIELARATLELAGMQVQGIGDGESALAAIQADPPDLVLMDVQLPQVDGLELTRRLKADARTAAVPVVAFTAYAMTGDEARFRAAGCDGYIAKPIDVACFAAQVRAYLLR
jgi:two-component system, cell cycle response regulator DivK